MAETAEAILALGGNLGEARDALDRAAALLCDGESVRLLARSSDYRTAPWGVVDQPSFVNSCLIVATTLSPRALLAHAERVETALGRDRTKETRWGPRPIDIDLIDYQGVALNEPRLVLPHPALFERAFVLAPLAEIAPDRIIAGVAVRDALARLDLSGIERLPPRGVARA